MSLRLSGLFFLPTITALALPVIPFSTPVGSNAINEFRDLKTITNSVATEIWHPVNEVDDRRSDNVLPVVSEAVGAASLIGNLTEMVLRMKINCDSNMNAWVNTSAEGKFPPLDDAYIDYVNAIPNLSSALIALGRSWHNDLNRPVYLAIKELQSSVNVFSTTLITTSLIHLNSTIRTIHASAALEDAQKAWSKILNLSADTAPTSTSPTSLTRREIGAKYRVHNATKSTPWDHRTAKMLVKGGPGKYSDTRGGEKEVEEDSEGLAKKKWPCKGRYCWMRDTYAWLTPPSARRFAIESLLPPSPPAKVEVGNPRSSSSSNSLNPHIHQRSIIAVAPIGDSSNDQTSSSISKRQYVWKQEKGKPACATCWVTPPSVRRFFSGNESEEKKSLWSRMYRPNTDNPQVAQRDSIWTQQKGKLFCVTCWITPQGTPRSSSEEISERKKGLWRRIWRLDTMPGPNRNGRLRVNVGREEAREVGADGR
ncbi:hypothetical protein GQ43DRAFT_465717 [Delitschia confertaspora ATCC 74209]|uniref:Uncharacterized protein n=1 Tax=Delitschia confertaspora ATCC 74209 TaxID=1513339 RepID=A0A9P4JFP9_9PLEO|nr:hypothetical protein GQ43DRAFT_465717 [Delitschia confertaspora ATCC 74209]